MPHSGLRAIDLEARRVDVNSTGRRLFSLDPFSPDAEVPTLTPSRGAALDGVFAGLN
jgi:hypothetical protein